MDCLFCKIATGEIPAQKVYEDDRIFVFHDIAPQAPIHLLAIPKTHIKSAAQITEANADLVAHIFVVLARLAGELGLSDGFRIVTNAGKDAQQTVDHIHFHLLAGRKLAWPPG